MSKPFDTRLQRVLRINSTSFNEEGATKDDTENGMNQFASNGVYTQTPFSYDNGDAEGEYNTDYSTNEYTRTPDDILARAAQSSGGIDDDHKKGAQIADSAIMSMRADEVRYKATASIMNPYAFTKLYGAKGGEFLVDRYDKRKYYEIDGTGAGHYAKNPTTANIIKWSGEDYYGRRPYQYQDFAFCKQWNVIENNRMVTLRRYAQPCVDNLNFHGMGENNGVTMHPISTAVTYFGGDSGNKLSDLLNFSASYGWTEAKGEIWDSTNQAPSMEKMNAATKWDKFFGEGMVNAATVLGFLGGSTQGNSNKFFDADADKGLPPDPYNDGQYSNRILGPINKISTAYKRDNTGLHFSMPNLKLKFDYVARPFGGINAKAALLDILSNILVMAYSSGVFWGGSHRFFIDPQRYPFVDEKARAAMHKGKIMGDNGAAQMLVQHYRTSITEGLGATGTDGASGVGVIFKNLMDAGIGELGDLAKAMGLDQAGGLLGKMGKAIVNEGDERLSNNEKARNMFNNFNSQIASTVQGRVGQIPFLSNMRAILTGEPVGDWHLTIGNPMNPIAEIGNLICKDLTITFSDELGPDDFPIGFTAEITLEHGSPRDRDGIEAMFNRGAGRIYVLPDKYSSSADGQTVVDKYTGTKGNGSYRWTDGYQVPARNTYSTKGQTDNTKGPFRDAYPEPDGASMSSVSRSINMNDLFYTGSMTHVYHHIMPWQTKIVL